MDRGEAKEGHFQQDNSGSSQVHGHEIPEGFPGQVEFDAEGILNGSRLSIESLEKAIEGNRGLESLWRSALSSALSYCATVDRFVEFQNSSAKFHLETEDFQARQGPLDQSRRDSHNGTVSSFEALARNLEKVNPVLSAELRVLINRERRDISNAFFLDLAMQEKLRQASEEKDNTQ